MNPKRKPIKIAKVARPQNGNNDVNFSRIDTDSEENESDSSMQQNGTY